MLVLLVLGLGVVLVVSWSAHVGQLSGTLLSSRLNFRSEEQRTKLNKKISLDQLWESNRMKLLLGESLCLWKKLCVRSQPRYTAGMLIPRCEPYLSDVFTYLAK